MVIIDPNIRNMEDEVINKKMEDELDKHFPKGDKARGRALVLNAVANIEIEKAKTQTIKEEIEYLKKEIEFITNEFKIAKSKNTDNGTQSAIILWMFIVQLKSRLKQQIKKLGEKK